MKTKTKRHFGECRRPDPKEQKRKRQYRIRNWPEYNAALVQRGSLTLWVDEAAVAEWHNHEHSGKRGKPRLYSELAITCMATLQVVFRLPLRSTQGLLRSVVQLLGVELEVPDYTTLVPAAPDAAGEPANSSQRAITASGGGFHRSQSLR